MNTNLEKLNRETIANTSDGLTIIVNMLNTEARKKNMRSKPFFLPRGIVTGMCCKGKVVIFTLSNGKGGFYHLETDFTCSELNVKQTPAFLEETPGFFRNIIDFFLRNKLNGIRGELSLSSMSVTLYLFE